MHFTIISKHKYFILSYDINLNIYSDQFDLEVEPITVYYHYESKWTWE